MLRHNSKELLHPLGVVFQKWHAIDHRTGAVLAYGFGRRKDEVFLKLKALIEPFGLTRYDTDHWGAYTQHLEPDVHSPGKRNTQKSSAST